MDTVNSNFKYKYNVLIVDDDLSGPKDLYQQAVASDQDYNPEPDQIDNPKNITKEDVIAHDIILLDYDFGKVSSEKGDYVLRLIQDYKKQSEFIEPKIILLSEMKEYHKWGTNLIEFFKIGIVEWIDKIIATKNPLIFKHILDKAISAQHSESEKIDLKTKEKIKKSFALSKPSDIIGKSKSINDLRVAIGNVSGYDETVFIVGQSGTGKELVAEAIHAEGVRQSKNQAKKPFIPLNCGAITETLAESELFGHEKGAFTGANYKKYSPFELADGGTIFLDEIGDMPLSLQVKLLRTIQDRKIQRVGSCTLININVRIIAATNKNIKKEIADGNFRQDLYYRLNVIPISIPPLSERKDDIPLLVEHFVGKFAEKYPLMTFNFNNGAIEFLKKYHWPGNVRELENYIKRIIIMAPNKASISKKDVESILPFPSISTNSFDPASIVDILFNDYYNANNKFIKQYPEDDFEEFEKSYGKLTKDSKCLQNYYNIRQHTIRKLKGLDNYNNLLNRKPKNKWSVAMKIKERLEKESDSKNKNAPEWKIAMVMGMKRGNFRKLKETVREKNEHEVKD